MKVPPPGWPWLRRIAALHAAVIVVAIGFAVWAHIALAPIDSREQTRIIGQLTSAPEALLRQQALQWFELSRQASVLIPKALDYGVIGAAVTSGLTLTFLGLYVLQFWRQPPPTSEHSVSGKRTGSNHAVERTAK